LANESARVGAVDARMAAMEEVDALTTRAGDDDNVLMWASKL
jgi:hypothetical protein